MHNILFFSFLAARRRVVQRLGASLTLVLLLFVSLILGAEKEGYLSTHKRRIPLLFVHVFAQKHRLFTQEHRSFQEHDENQVF